jgi:DNA invertase Pin-like site-specific DNA recombinase
MAARRKVIGYVRVSTIEQVSGFGLDVQEQAIREHCRREGLHLVSIERDEGESGGNGLDTRDGLAAAIAQLEAGKADGLVVYRLDRLARDLVLQETLIVRLRAAGRIVDSVTEGDDVTSDDPTRELIRQILGAFAQYDRATIRGRLLAGKAAKRSRGGYVGGQPAYGRAAEGKELVAREDERAVVEAVVRLRREGRSYREICAQLEADGLRPRRAARWQPKVVRDIAARAGVAGQEQVPEGRLTPEQVALAQRLYDAKGHSVQAIADTLGVPRSTLYGHLKRTDWNPDPVLSTSFAEQRAEGAA